MPKTMQRIKELREKLGLSGREFAREISISNSSFSYYESGKRNPSIQTCYKILQYAKSKGISIDLEWLMPKP